MFTICKIPSWSYPVVSLHCSSRCSWHLCCVLRSGTRWSGIGARVRTTAFQILCLWTDVAYVMKGHLLMYTVIHKIYLHNYASHVVCYFRYMYIFLVTSLRSLTGAGIFITTVVIGTVIVVSKTRPFNIGEWLGAPHTRVIMLDALWYLGILLSPHCRVVS